jgi:hypothetical protein
MPMASPERSAYHDENCPAEESARAMSILPCPIRLIDGE